jgi:hypothetical protein
MISETTTEQDPVAGINVLNFCGGLAPCGTKTIELYSIDFPDVIKPLGALGDLSSICFDTDNRRYNSC